MTIKVIGASPEEAFAQLAAYMRGSRTYLMGQRAQMVGALVSAQVPFVVYQHFLDLVPRVDALVATPGLQAFALARPVPFDVNAEWATTKAAMIAARDGLSALMPVDGNGFTVIVKVLPGGLQWRTVTQAQAAPAVALIDAVLATLE